jgi:sulfite exporter TauE/SafE
LASLRARDQVKSSLYLGLITVFLPCMTLTPALGAAAASGSAGGGLITMLAFFLGTLPVMLVGPGLSGSVLSKLPQGGGRKVGAIFLLLAAGITIWRGYH